MDRIVAPMMRRLSPTGVAVAVAFYCLALTPSLLPRPWYLQGVISGILAATGYLVGVFAAYLLRPLVPRRWRAPNRIKRRAVWGIGGFFVLALTYQGTVWQREIHSLFEMRPPAWYAYLGVPPLAGGIFVGLLEVARVLRAGVQALAEFLGRWIKPAVFRVIATVVVLFFLFSLIQGLVSDVVLGAANNAFRAVNEQMDPELEPPRSPLLSGGPGSLLPWDTLGREGRSFVAGGPVSRDLRRFSGRGPIEPVRIYVGLDSADTVRDRAELAVAELERTGAFSRAVICIITPTGTGWINPRAVYPLEYMYNGDTALVAVQYSFLPSWMSFMTDPEPARDAGRELFNQIYDRWSEEPARDRPKLLVYGESLGAFGAEAAFSGVDDFRLRTDGVLLVGPPNNSELWREFVAARDPGTREVLPTYQSGETVRFAGDPADLVTLSQWEHPRVVYLQHVADPVVWWSPQLLLNRPDWLSEPRDREVATMRWYPFVTFWQVTADLVFAAAVPPGHGHDYGKEPVDAWAQIAPPPDWDDERTVALKEIIPDARSPTQASAEPRRP
jgi:uncharacterized membrane protein